MAAPMFSKLVEDFVGLDNLFSQLDTGKQVKGYQHRLAWIFPLCGMAMKFVYVGNMARVKSHSGTRSMLALPVVSRQNRPDR